MKINVYIIYSFLLIWGIAEIFIGRWVFRTQPKKNIVDKYPKKVIVLASLPFGTTWKKQVEKEHVKVLATYQGRVRICFLSIIIPLLLFYFYISFKF